MKIVIAGGHGKIALRLAELLAKRGDETVGLVRNPDHVPDIDALGARGVLCDLEQAGTDEVAAYLIGADAVVFAAGAGPGSGIARKDTVDRAAAQLLADAAEQADVPTYVQISSMGAGRAPSATRGEAWAAYINAKTRAEEDLRARDLNWTIIRPGMLTDDPGTGRVTLAEPPVPRGPISRDDVALVIAEILSSDAATRRTLELVAGDTPVPDAVRALRQG
ncbi:NAD-dependent dehydratase [Actinomadura craniellae]|uniref:NAD-dependent dehydratase n=1 Tax=Actinomadura craniellae TaxID=2231787 RepID=A0A365H6U9_9ACTN|nr:SDR family oxidoreductase [Actinomadura craniellae]RAY14801.1 NAD-dependent dehydratase [Actinomadura craniellae]